MQLVDWLTLATLVVAVVAAVAGVWSLVVARRAKTLSAAADARSLELHDVYWSGSWVSPGVYRYVNRGTDTAAHHVRATVEADGQAASETVDVVGPGEHVDLDCPWVRYLLAQEHHRREIERHQEAVAAERERSIFTYVPPPLPLPMRLSTTYTVRERVEWTTTLETPRLWEKARPLSTLKPDPTG